MFPVGSLFRLRVSHHLDRAAFPAPASSVGSRTGAPVAAEAFRPLHVSSPRHVARSVRISRTTRTHLLRAKAYETYPAGATFGSA